MVKPTEAFGLVRCAEGATEEEKGINLQLKD